VLAIGEVVLGSVRFVVLAGAARSTNCVRWLVCVRTGTAGLSLVSIVTTVLASDHRAAVLCRSECNLCYRIERWVMFGEGGMHATKQRQKVPKGGILNNNNAEFWNWVSPRHEKARAAGRISAT
jgi:hypothetical protein